MAWNCEIKGVARAARREDRPERTSRARARGLPATASSTGSMRITRGWVATAAAEEPARAGPSTVEGKHQGVHAESDGHGVFGVSPDHRDVSTGPRPRRRTAPPAVASTTPRRVGQGVTGEERRAADQDLVRSEHEPRRRMGNFTGKLSVMPRPPVTMATGRQEEQDAGKRHEAGARPVDASQGRPTR